VRRWFAGALALVLVLALAGATAWSQRKPLAHWWTLRQLAQRGIAPASVEVARIDGSRFELRGLRAGAEGQLSIDAIDADYTLGQLWRGRVAALRIVGVRLTGEIAEGEARFGGLEGRGGAEDAADDTASALRLPVLPTNQLVIEDARAEIATAQGPLAVVLSLNAQDSEGKISAHGDLVARHPLAQATAKLELAGEGDQVAGGAAIGLRMAQGADLGLPLSAGSIALAAQVELAGEELRVALLPGYVALTLGKGKDALKLEGKTPNATLRSQLDDDFELGPIAVAVAGGELRSPTLGFVARGFELDGQLELPWRLDGRFAVRELQDTKKPVRTPSLTLEGRFEPRDQGLDFELNAAESKRRVVWHAQGSFDPEAGSGDAKLRMEPVVFAKDGLQPAQLAPQLAGFVKSATGTLEATGRVQYAAGKPRLALELAARDLALETPNAQFEGVNGTLRLDGPSPFSTPPGQLFSIGRTRFGLDLTDGVVSAQLRPDGVVVIEKAEWHTLGGRVFTAGSVDPEAPHQALVLEAENLDFAQLLALVDLEGLSGEGLLDGRLPIDRSAEAIEIRGGVLRARPGARIRYHPAAGVASLKQSERGFELLLGAFEDLTVETLVLELDGDANGTMKLVLHLVGVNPEFQDGRPLHYNLSIESRLADLLRKGAAVYKLPQEIEERLQRFEQKAR
jgi:hypothetical protein